MVAPFAVALGVALQLANAYRIVGLVLRGLAESAVLGLEVVGRLNDSEAIAGLFVVLAIYGLLPPRRDEP